MSEKQMNYNRLVAQLRSLSSECDTLRSLAWEAADDIIKHGAMLVASKAKLKLREAQIPAVRKKIRFSRLSETL